MSDDGTSHPHQRLEVLEEIQHELCAYIVLHDADEWRERQALMEFRTWLDRKIAEARTARG